MDKDEKIKRVIEFFAAQTGVPVKNLMGGQDKSSCIARYMAVAYLHNEMKVSGYKLASVFGQTRINLLRGIRVLRNWLKYHSDIRAKYFEVINKLEEVL